MTYTDLTLESLYGLTLENLESLPIDDTPEPNGVTFYMWELDEFNITSVAGLQYMAMGEPPIELPYLASVYVTGICAHEVYVYSV